MSIIFVFISQKRHVISKNNIRFGFSAILKLFKILQKTPCKKNRVDHCHLHWLSIERFFVNVCKPSA